MKRIRQLYIQSQHGDSWGLNGERGVYATNLSGFGYTLSPDYVDLSRGFFSASDDAAEPQSALAMTIVFTQNAYATYYDFQRWIATAGNLSIRYSPQEGREFSRDVAVNFFQKGELTANGWLEIPSSFASLSPWYAPTPVTVSMDATSSGADNYKRYDYTYSDLAYGTASTGSVSTDIAADGHVPGAIDLVYFGAINNPQIRIVGATTGVTYGVCKIGAILDSTDRLEYSTRYKNSYVYKISADGTVTDLLEYLDLNGNPYPHLPITEPVCLSIEADAAFSGKIELTIYRYYRSV